MLERWFIGAWCAVVVCGSAACGSDAQKPGAAGSGAPSASAEAPSASTSATIAPKKRASFAIRRMADDHPIVSRSLQNLPKGGAFFDEQVALGAVRTEVPPEMVAKICGGGVACEMDGKRAFIQQPMGAMRTFIRIVAQDDETPKDSIERLRAYLGSFAPPDKGAEYAYGELVEIDSETKQLRVVGARNYVVMGPSPVSEKDVVEVVALTDPDKPARIDLRLSEEAAERVEKFTTENVFRRIALLVGGVVVAAPVVTAPIPGGSISMTISQDEKATQAEIDQAKLIAAALTAPP